MKGSKTPSDELFSLQPIEIILNENELPGSPRDKVFCVSCNEKVMDGKQLIIGRKFFVEYVLKVHIIEFYIILFYNHHSSWFIH